ncbi:sugar phosphate isomerase/epimerase [Dyadobacter jejuensis]|uniref:Sugar phosphate isomerase/epimerase n=1 Tax=Dyadobacter jejuensis TaxID=1082580 RepID=A0A316AFZ0_9BACT|nr:TIM barrel protein [Dyadobacter jejuensis]PWJ56623.1 sugar phosphate isomerase/epimerase [Dyadobacter jejuensis]
MMNRRNFMATTLAGGGALSALQAMGAETPFENHSGKKLSLKVLGTNWGFKGTVDAFCAAVKQEGYDGIEMWWQSGQERRKELFAAIKKYDLEIGYLCGSHDADFKKHFEAFRKGVNEAATQSERKPLYINCHSGRDYFSFEENQALIDHTLEVSAKTGIPIAHETHRSRMLFAAHIAKRFLEENPAMKITLDISHWCNVHESLLADQPEAVKLALERTIHIHARVGHQEGPQVSDPRAPEWATAMKAHLDWWDTVVAYKIQNNEPLTVLTEFGPPAYLPTMPYTNLPVADQWGINVHMMQLFRERYLK